jgi:hypothetical protein
MESMQYPPLPIPTLVQEPVVQQSAAESTEIVRLRTRILSQVIALSEPAPPPDAWEWLGKLPHIRTLSDERENVLERLSRDFAPDELLATRVAYLDAGGAIKLSPIFGTTGSMFVICYEQPNVPVDVRSARGLLSVEGPEWYRVVAQRNMKGDPVLLAASDHEAQILEHLEIRWIAAGDVVNLTGAQIHKLFKSRSRDYLGAETLLTLVGCQLEWCDNTPSDWTVQAIWRVADIKFVVPQPPSTLFNVWLPSDPEFRAITKPHRFADLSATKRAVKKSLYYSQVTPFGAKTVLADRQPASYASARARLESFIKDSNESPPVGDIDVMLNKLEAAFNKLIAPLEPTSVAGNCESAGALESLCQVMAADLGRKWFNSREILHAARRILGGHHPRYSDVPTSESIRDTVQISNAVARLARTLRPR